MKPVLLSNILTEARSGFWGHEAGTVEVDALVIRNGDVQEDGLRWDALPLRGITQSEYERAQVRKGDIVLTTSGDCGFSAYITEEPQAPTIASNFVRLLRFDEQRIFARYAFHLIHSDTFRRRLGPFIRGTTLKNLSLTNAVEAVDLPIPFPDDPRRSLAEQKRIAAILDKADAIRRRRQEAARLADTLIPSVFQEMFGVDPMVSGRWKPERLDALVDPEDKINYGVVQPGTDVKDGVPIVRVGDFDSGRISTRDLKRIEPEIEAQYARSRLKGDEVLLACVGSIGLVALADDGLKGFNTVRAVARIRCGKRLHREYLASLLATGRMQQYFKGETRTVSQPTLNIGHIEAAMISLPPFDLQSEFARRVRTIRGLHERHSDQALAGENLFNSLVQRAFRGDL